MDAMTKTGGTLRLARRQTLDLGRRGGQAVTCVQGSLWLTVDNDSRDIVLEPGQTYQVEAGERVLVFALHASTLSVQVHEVAKAVWAGEAVAA